MRRPGKSSGNQIRQLREYLLDKYGDGERVRCFNCGIFLTADTVTVDRIKPGSKGGRYTKNNVQPLCQPCNQLKGDRELKGKLPVQCDICKVRLPTKQSLQRHHMKEHLGRRDNAEAAKS
ncbi:MAG: HNH endonuclease [Thermodesulfobacteriota bacterium]